MSEECNFTTPEQGGGVNEEGTAQVQEVIDKQEQTQEQQTEQQTENIPEPVRIKQIRYVRYLPPAFQIYLNSGWIMKVVIDGHKAINCSYYKSRSGLTWHGCYRFYNGEFQEVRGLYIVEPSELVVSSRAKLTWNITEMDELILDTLRLYKLFDERLISYGNWGFSVYDIYHKAPTFTFEEVARQGHLYVFRVPSPRYIEGMEETDKITIYNHQITFSRSVKATQLTDEGTGVVYIVNAADITAFKTISPDHGEADASISPGWYLFVHQTPANNID